ncbi:MAG: S-adenosyl-l-methionine hydroxide adenosyltransferase family protein, partial [Gemmataceae bacterium]
MITLTTDFGTRSPFVAAMKGVILSINPEAQIQDLSHDLPPYDIRHACFFLSQCLPYFPPGTIHVVVVDPEVGTRREVLLVEMNRTMLLVPDNGCWTLLERHAGSDLQVRRLSSRRYWRDQVSSTFHGRDILAPVAAHLSLGVSPDEMGSLTRDYRRISWPEPHLGPHSAEGQVVFVDHFGNLMTNLGRIHVGNGALRVYLGSDEIPQVTTYGEAKPGELVALFGSGDLIEIAEVQGNASRRLNAGVGSSVRVEW